MFKGKVQLKGTDILWRSRSDPSDPSSPCVKAVPLCFELGGFQSDRLVLGPHLTRGAPVLLQILVGQLAASQETYFNYHKSLGLFPFILFFNGLCMYHLMQMTYSKVLFLLEVLFFRVFTGCVCVQQCVVVCVISYERYQLLSPTHL